MTWRNCHNQSGVGGHRIRYLVVLINGHLPVATALYVKDAALPLADIVSYGSRHPWSGCGKAQRN